MPENEIEKELLSPPPLMPELDTNPKAIDSPEIIVRDLLKTEKDIALETLRLMRSRYEKERLQWEKIYGGKEREIIELKTKLDESESRVKHIKERLNDEQNNLVEQLRQKANEFEAHRLADKHKWELIGEEVRGFRETAQSSQAKLSNEIETAAAAKKEFLKREKALQERINTGDDEISKLKEQILAKEETFLKFKSDKDEELRMLQESLAALRGDFDNEKQEKGKVIEKKETDLDNIKKALQDTMIQLNIERKKKEDAAEASQKQAQRAAELEEELKKTAGKYETDRAEYAASYREEQLSWEKYKKEFIAKEETLRHDTEEQVTRILKSVGIIEQQLAEEQQLKKTAEDKLKFKDEEIRKLLEQKDEITIEWRKMLTSEQELRIKRQAEILGEFDKVKAAREEDFRVLRAEINNLQGALAEENKLYIMEREQNKQLLQKAAYLDENRQSLITQLEAKEKTWKDAVGAEQELYKKQIEESVNSSAAQVKARDGEITRLDEDINMLNGQILELRQKLSLEKNENNNRLDRISEYEAQIKSLTSKYNDERAQWNQKFKFIQQQWEEQRQSLMDYQKNIEDQHKNDIKGYDERIKMMNEKLTELSGHKADEETGGRRIQSGGENTTGGRNYPRK